MLDLLFYSQVNILEPAVSNSNTGDEKTLAELMNAVSESPVWQTLWKRAIVHRSEFETKARFVGKR